MSDKQKIQQEESLDPADWGALGEVAHQAVDDMLDFLKTLRERPIWQPMPDDVLDYFKQPLPQEPQSEAEVYGEFLEQILPYSMGNIHPSFWGWVIGTGTPIGALAEFLAAIMNPNVGGGNHVANNVEQQVIDWCKEIFDFPSDSSGLLVSGGSMANFVGLTVARNAKAEIDLREHGVHAAPRRMMLYCSVEAHSSIKKGMELLGLGRDSLREIPVNSDFQIDIEALEVAIADDRAAGHYPFAIVGNAGTVNTGAFDDLNALADLAAEEDLWFHVDGAFGAFVWITEDYRHLANGLSRADSLAFDLHKWMYMPIEIGCALVRDNNLHYNTFTYTPEYLTHGERGVASGERWFSDYGLQLSRSFRGLKAWMSFKNFGFKKYQRLIQQNIEQVQYLMELVEAEPDLESIAPHPSNIGCFRYVVEGWSTERLNDLNRDIIYELHERGIAVPSYTLLNGIYGLRCANTNHRTTREDFAELIDAVKEIAAELITT